MKFIDGCVKLVAAGLVLMLVLVLPFALFLQSVGSLLLSPGAMGELVEDNLVDPDIMAYFLEDQVGKSFGHETGTDPFSRILLDGLDGLDHEQWVELTVLLAPPELISQTLDEVLIGYYKWLDGSDEIPQITLDLRQWKSNLVTNFIPAVDLVMYTLPECSRAEQLKFLSAGVLSTEAASCRPVDPVYALFIEQVGTTIPAFIEELPDEYNVSRQLEQDETVDWIDLKMSLSRLAAITQASWVVVLVIFAVAIPMGARSFSGVFKWAGWPVLLVGIVSLLLAAILILISQGRLSNYNPFLGFVKSAPPMFSRPIKQLLGEGLRSVAKPLLLESVVMILLGGISLIIGFVIAPKNDKALPVSSADTPHIPPSPAPSMHEQIGDSVNEPFGLGEDELDQKQEDEEKPSGMFG